MNNLFKDAYVYKGICVSNLYYKKLFEFVYKKEKRNPKNSVEPFTKSPLVATHYNSVYSSPLEKDPSQETKEIERKKKHHRTLTTAAAALANSQQNSNSGNRLSP